MLRFTWLLRSERRRTARQGRRFVVEGLEPRRLLALVINEFPIPTANSAPLGITTGPDGNLWFTEQFASKIGQINPTTHAVVEFATPTASARPVAITMGPDGNLWFTEEGGANKVAMINPTSHVITEFPTPTPNSTPGGITAGPDGNLWFTEINKNQIGMINPTTHVITEFPIPTPASTPFDITAGPDGNLWFTEGATAANAIGQINPTTHAIAEFPVPTAKSQPDDITLGPDGNLWFTESSASKIGQINPTTHAIAEFPTPTANSDPIGITAGSDGNLWFTENVTDKIGQINPTTHALAEFPVPTAGGSEDLGITNGPDGNIWFTEPGNNLIAQAVISAATTPTTTILSAAPPSPSLFGQTITFTAVVSSAAAEVTPTGTVTFTIDGQAQAPVALALVGGFDQATLPISTLALGSHTITATYNGNASFSPSTSNPLTQVVTATSASPEVISVERFGFHSFPTSLVLTFDQQIDHTRAQALSNYRLTTHGGRTLLRLNSAVYDATTRSVTLHPRHLLPLRAVYQLIVNGTMPNGITNTAGQFLQGIPGIPGSNFVTTITRSNLVLTPGGVPTLHSALSLARHHPGARSRH